MWTEITCPQYERSDLRYASDLTDKEWKVITSHLPDRKRHVRPRTTDLREVLNASFYMARTGWQRRVLLREFPPRSKVQRYFYPWSFDGTLRTLNHHLLMAAREAAGREASPSAGVIDSQSVKPTENGGIRGFDASELVTNPRRRGVRRPGREYARFRCPARLRPWAESGNSPRFAPRKDQRAWRRAYHGDVLVELRVVDEPPAQKCRERHSRRLAK